MKRAFVVVVAGCFCQASFASAQEVQQFKGEDGRTYQQITRLESRPTSAVNWEESRKTVYKEQYVTELRDAYRTVYSPVTEYLVEPRWHNWWNPFGQPYVAYHMRPWTRWETRYERYQTPVTVRELVPEVRTVLTPSRTTGMAMVEVTEMVAVTPRPQQPSMIRAPVASTPHIVARNPLPIGGLERLESDPPRYR